MTTPLRLRKDGCGKKVGLHGLTAANRDSAITQLTQDDTGVFTEKMVVTILDFLANASPEDLLLLEVGGSEENGRCRVQSLGPYASRLIRTQVEIDAAIAQHVRFTSHELKVIYDVPTAVDIFKPLSIH